MNKFLPITLLLSSILLFSENVRSSVPPHPRVAEMIEAGKIPPPYFLLHRDEALQRGINAGPPNVPAGKKFGLRIPATVTYKALAILVRFSDHPSHVSPAFFDSLLFSPTGRTFRNYYHEVSYGALDIVTVNLPSALGWILAPRTYSYYVNGGHGFGAYPQNAQKLAEDAITAADPVVNFADYDNDGDGYVDALFILHSGPGAEYTGSPNDIWSHQWATSTPQAVDGVYASTYSMEPEYWQGPGDMTCGVYAHEAGHAIFGLPDLYDYGYDSYGLGNWSVMASGSWGGPTHMGNYPSHPDAWSRCAMGFVVPTNITANAPEVTIPAVHDSSKVFRLWTDGNAGSTYFLVENRQKLGYDAYLPGDGLCIYHIDESQSGNNNQWYPGHTSYGHYKVAFEQADGLWELERILSSGNAGDPYPGSGDNRTFGSLSAPDSRDYSGGKTSVAVTAISNSGPTMSANFSVQFVAPSISVTPMSFDLTMGSGDTARRTMTISNAGPGILEYEISAFSSTLMANPPAASKFKNRSVSYPAEYFAALPKGTADTRRGVAVPLEHGGSAAGGYQWRDSDEPGGPVFEWVDITASGTRIPMSGDDDNAGPYPIGFSFPYYGQTYSSFRICTNGWVSFTSPNTAYTNYPMPSLVAPENLLAVFWTDLVFSSSQAYYYSDGTRLIIQYDRVPRLSESLLPNSFEIILTPSGRIIYQYLSMRGTLTTSTVGIQNATRDTGVTVAFNTAYLHDNLRIEFQRALDWLAVSPAGGAVPAGQSQDVDILLNAGGLAGGNHGATLSIVSDDTARNPVTVPVTLTVIGQPRIAVVPEALVFGDVYAGYSRTDTLMVRNVGSDLLEVTAIGSDNPAFTPAPSSFSVPAFAAQPVLVTFAPPDTGQMTGTLTIASNDTSQPSLRVPLGGHGFFPPVMTVSPDSIVVTINEGDSASQTMTISNNGLSNLAFTLVHRLDGGAGTYSISDTRGAFNSFEPQSAAYTTSLISTVDVDRVLQLNSEVPLPATIAPSAYNSVIPAGSGGGKLNFKQITQLRARFVVQSKPLKTAVLRSFGATYATRTWDTLNAAWGTFGSTPIVVDYRSLNKQNITYSDLVNSGADVLMISDAWSSSYGWEYTDAEWAAIKRFVEAGHGLIATCGSLDTYYAPNNPQHLAPLVGLDSTLTYIWSITAQYMNFADAQHPLLRGLIQPYMPADLRTAIPRATGSWMSALHGGHVVAISPNNSTVIITNENRVYFSNFPELYTNQSDFQLLYNAMVWCGSQSFRWLTEIPTEGTIPAGGNQQIQVKETADGLDGGVYDATIVISNNDPSEESVNVHVHLHVVGKPHVVVQPDTLEFGNIFTGCTRTDTLLVQNTGSDTLIVSDISSANPRFTFTPPTLTIPAHQGQSLLVTFAPTDDGRSTGTLTLLSNDPTHPATEVFLGGEGVYPPGIALSPDSFEVSLTEGDSTTRTLTVANTGRSDLVWTAAISGGSLPAVSFYALPPAVVSSNAVVREYPLTATKSSSTRQMQNSTIEVGKLNSLLLDLTGKRIGITDTVFYIVVAADLRARGAVVSEVKFPLSAGMLSSLDVLAVDDAIGTASSSDIDAIRDWLGTGRGLLVQGDDASSMVNINNLLAGTGIREAPLGTSSDAKLAHIVADQITQGVDTIVAGAYGAYSAVLAPAQTIVYDDALRPHAVVSTFGAGRVVVVGNEVSATGNLMNGDTRLFANRIFDWLMGGGNFLTTTPSSGTVAPGGSQDVIVAFQGAHLPGGNYSANIVFTSNDPLHNPVSVPSHLRVISKPHIEVVPDSLEFGKVFTDVGRTDTLQVRNIGSDVLIVTSISSSNPFFTCSPGSFTTPAHATQEVLVTFSPADSGSASGLLTIVSNDTPRSPIQIHLKGRGEYSPSITVSRDSVELTLDGGDSLTQAMTIGNTGRGILRFRISSEHEGGRAPATRTHPSTIVHVKPAMDPRTSGNTANNESGPRYPYSLPQDPSDTLLKVLTIDLNLPENYQALDMLGFHYTKLSPAAFDTVNLYRYAVIYVGWTSGASTSGMAALYSRRADIRDFVEGGGGLVALSNVPSTPHAWQWLPVTLSASSHIGNIVRITQPSHPVMEFLTDSSLSNWTVSYHNLFDAYDASLQVLALGTDLGANAPLTLAGEVGAGRVVLTGQDADWHYVNRGDPGAGILLRNMLRWASHGGVPWLSVAPDSGTVLAAGSQELSLRINTENLPGGDFGATMRISNNDPRNNLLFIPVYLHVRRPAISISVSRHWNIVSLPLTMTDCRKTTMFSTAVSEAFAYIPGGGYVTRGTLEYGAGYWIRFDADQRITLSGAWRPKDTIEVEEGWNLIGSISAPIPVSTIGSTDAGMLTSPFFGYCGGYVSVDTLQPGSGYWVKCSREGALILSLAGSGLATQSASSIRIITTSEMPPSPPSDEALAKPLAPQEYALSQSFPNPFNPMTRISYQLPVDSRVTLRIYNVAGQLVDVLVESNQETGYKQVEWNASHFASGVYFYRLEAASLADPTNHFMSVKKMLLMK